MKKGSVSIMVLGFPSSAKESRKNTYSPNNYVCFCLSLKLPINSEEVCISNLRMYFHNVLYNQTYNIFTHGFDVRYIHPGLKFVLF